MVSSSRRSAASGASLFSGMVTLVGVPTTEATAPYDSGGANCTAGPPGEGYPTGGPAGGGKAGPDGYDMAGLVEVGLMRRTRGRRGDPRAAPPPPPGGGGLVPPPREGGRRGGEPNRGGGAPGRGGEAGAT